jgi:hypothetical protein
MREPLQGPLQEWSDLGIAPHPRLRALVVLPRVLGNEGAVTDDVAHARLGDLRRVVEQSKRRHRTMAAARRLSLRGIATRTTERGDRPRLDLAVVERLVPDELGDVEV